MILYVNGDSHAAGAECVNPHAWAEDDSLYHSLGKQPHPENLLASFGYKLSNHLNATLVCEAQAGGSNERILRTTRQWLSNNHADLVVIQWSTWEREEWEHHGEYYQVNASGIDHVPPELQQRYRDYILGIDWNQKTLKAHDTIWEFHQELLDQNINHVFFNGNNDFSILGDSRYTGLGDVKHKDWGRYYIGPYDPQMTYDRVLRNNGFEWATPGHFHFRADAHCFWAEYLLQYIIDNKLL